MSNVDRHKLKEDIRVKLDQHKDWLRKMKEEDYDNLDENNEDPQYNEYEQQYKQQKPRKSGKRKGEKKRWDQLYELKQFQKETKEYMKNALAEEEEDDPECTFHPKISEVSQLIIQKNNRPDFIHRNEMWVNQKQENMKQKGENREDKELLHCTFEPQLNKNRVNHLTKDTKFMENGGVTKFLERQEAARKERERRHTMLNGARRTDEDGEGEGKGKGRRKKVVNRKLTIPSDPNLSAFRNKDKSKNGEPHSNKPRNPTKKEIEEMYNDPTALYPTNCSLRTAIMDLHDHLNSFEMIFD